MTTLDRPPASGLRLKTDVAFVRPVPGEPEVSIEIRHGNVWYGDTQALHDVSLALPRHRVSAFIGPSGCGKSTLLRCVNRMNDVIEGVRISGQFRAEGVDLYAPATDVIEVRRRIGMVFQKPNPLAKSIYENVVYPLRVAGIRDRATLETVCEQSLRATGLWDEVKDRLDASGLALSGGQQQRLCIARAIAVEPEIVLLDEPCSALDPIATGHVEELLHELKSRYTILIVTHNLQQAARVSDYTAFFWLGRLVEFGPTEELFTRPASTHTDAYVTGRFG